MFGSKPTCCNVMCISAPLLVGQSRRTWIPVASVLIASCWRPSKRQNWTSKLFLDFLQGPVCNQRRELSYRFILRLVAIHYCFYGCAAI
jgi:hypothetical protein